MDRLIFVVRPDRRELYERLRALLGGEPAVEIVIDRRSGASRRLRELSMEPERRRVDRRFRQRVDAEIRERGWSVIRVSQEEVGSKRPLDPFPSDTGFIRSSDR